MFLDKENVDVLWEVLIDERIAGVNPNIFKEQLNAFWEKERNSGTPLFQMNTQFITHIIKLFKQRNEWSEKQLDLQKRQQKQPQQQHQQQQQKQYDGPVRLNIQDSEPNNFSITAEELHAERLGEFEKQLNQKQNEFSSMMSKPVPEMLDFSDVKDEPITELEELIAKTLQQRNFDIEQIHQSNQQIGDPNWLKGTDTSLKTENKRAVANATANVKKQISWQDESDDVTNISNTNANANTNANTNDDIITTSIFAKLKQVKEPVFSIELEIREINLKLDRILTHLNLLS